MTPAGNVVLIDAVSKCTSAAQVCLQHCIARLSTGDTSMAECARTVRDMLAICGAMGPIASANSELLQGLAALCQRACQACADACRKHADHHAECRACAEACEGTLAVVKKFV